MGSGGGCLAWIAGQLEITLSPGALFALRGHCVLRRGQGLPFPTPLSPPGALPPLRSGQVFLAEAEHFRHNRRCQCRYDPMVFGFIRITVRNHPGLVFGIIPESRPRSPGIPTRTLMANLSRGQSCFRPRIFSAALSPL